MSAGERAAAATAASPRTVHETIAPIPGLVTVIVPAYNASRWVEAALASVAEQSYAALEIVVADNGSTDSTISLVEKAAPHARVLHVERRGPSAARNAALDAARGEFVQYLDADDLLAPDKISTHVDALRESGADVAWGAFSRFVPGADADPFAGSIRMPALSDDVAREVIGAHGFLHLGAALFRRCGALAGLRFDETTQVVEDVRYVVQAALRGAQFVRVPGPPLYALREHDSPERASRRLGEGAFWDACAKNARIVRDGWRERGLPLTPARVDALVDAWLSAAEVFHNTRDPRLGIVLADLRELDPAFVRRLRQPHRAVARLVGYRGAFALADQVKRLRRLRALSPVATRDRDRG